MSDDISKKTNNQRSDDILDIGIFLTWAAEDGNFYGGVEAEDALSAFCRIINVPEEEFKRIFVNV